MVLCDNLEERDGVEDGREFQGGGDICILMADSHCCMAKPLHYCKVISLQLIKIIGEKI